jgi:hypothetical protein
MLSNASQASNTVRQKVYASTWPRPRRLCQSVDWTGLEVQRRCIVVCVVVMLVTRCDETLMRGKRRDQRQRHQRDRSGRKESQQRCRCQCRRRSWSSCRCCCQWSLRARTRWSLTSQNRKRWGQQERCRCFRQGRVRVRTRSRWQRMKPVRRRLK